MSLEIQKIRLKELEEFIASKTFRDFEFVPISPIRAKSYLENPNSQADDIVLYLGFFENRLVAFRSLWADVVNSENNKIRFAWCSGNWVHTDFRRKGFSEQLLKEAYSDWNQKLMFTNYAPNSEELYLKTGWFKAIHEFDGVRAYLFPKTRKLITKSNSNFITKLFFSIVDFIISIISHIYSWFFQASNNSEIVFETIEFPDEECFRLTKVTDIFFNRGEKELKWILKHPWISTHKKDQDERYPFSCYSQLFYYKTIKVFSNQNLVGYFIFSVKEGHLKTLHCQLPDSWMKDVALFMKTFCKQNKIEVATIYKKELAAELLKRKFPFLHLKKYGQKIYSTFEIKNDVQLIFQDGDGDVIFT